MSISLRILLGFGLNVLLLAAIGLFALGEINDVRTYTGTIVSRDIAAFRQVAAVHSSQDVMAALRLTVLERYREARAARTLAAGATGGTAIGTADADAQLRAATTDWERQAQTTTDELDAVRRLADGFGHDAMNPARRQAWTEAAGLLRGAGDQLRQLRADTGSVFAALRGGDEAAAAAAGPRLDAQRVAFDQSMEQVSATLDAGVRAGQDQIGAIYTQSRLSIIGAIVAAVLLACIVTVLIQRSIALPLAALAGVVERIGEGDLTARAEGRARDEIGRLGLTLNAMVEGLRRLAKQNRDATEDLNVAVAEIRASTQQQAAGVEEQLAAVQETAATVDEIAHSGAQITRRAREVIASAEETSRTSADGLRAVQDSGRAMELAQVQGEAVAANIVALSEKTEAIGEIIATVNDISERSHLLALNAAIEAAAVGEHGRSFAVVASEMKVLADQAKAATGQVRAILGEIQRGINGSVMLTEEAVKRGAAGRARTETAEATIDEMAGGIQEAVQTFQQIVASTNQQQLGIEQVTAALNNIRDASRQTAAGTRQLDQAASGLGELSRRLTAAADRFRF